MEKPLVKKKYLLEKYPGKGGWTYAIVATIGKLARGEKYKDAVNTKDGKRH